MSDKEEKQPLYKRLIDTVILSGAASVVLALVGGAVTLIWTATINIDESIKAATSNIVATQQVTAEELESLQARVTALETVSPQSPVAFSKTNKSVPLVIVPDKSPTTRADFLQRMRERSDTLIKK
jgi:hypothetical protein